MKTKGKKLQSLEVIKKSQLHVQRWLKFDMPQTQHAHQGKSILFTEQKMKTQLCSRLKIVF